MAVNLLCRYSIVSRCAFNNIMRYALLYVAVGKRWRGGKILEIEMNIIYKNKMKRFYKFII